MTRRSCYRRRLGPVVFLLYYCSFVLFVPSVLVPAFKRHHSVIPHFVLQSLGFPFAVGFVSSLPTHMSHTSSYSTVYGFLLSRTFFFFYPRLTLCKHRLFAFSFWYTQHRLPCVSLHTLSSWLSYLSLAIRKYTSNVKTEVWTGFPRFLWCI